MVTASEGSRRAEVRPARLALPWLAFALGYTQSPARARR
jgi:hypothetical protein